MWQRIISRTVAQAQKVPLRPPPFLSKRHTRFGTGLGGEGRNSNGKGRARVLEPRGEVRGQGTQREGPGNSEGRAEEPRGRVTGEQQHKVKGVESDAKTDSQS